VWHLATVSKKGAAHDSKCNTMQHNVTRHYEYSRREHQVWHLATVSKKGAAQRSADLSNACRPITKQTQSARQPTIRTIQNATQCNTMLTRHYECSRREHQVWHLATVSKKRAQPNGQWTSRTPAAPLRSKPNLPGNQRFARLKMQHNATQCSLAITNAVGGNTRCGISRLSQKRVKTYLANHTAARYSTTSVTGRGRAVNSAFSRSPASCPAPASRVLRLSRYRTSKR
jgi:hypothetical protein